MVVDKNKFAKKSLSLRELLIGSSIIMDKIKVHVLRTGEVRVSPYLPFGSDDSSITLDKKLQRESLQWIREQSLSPDCVESLATHDTDVEPHVIEL